MGWTVYNSDGQILQGSSTLADDAVTTAKILDANVTLAKIASQAANTVLVRDANSSGVVSAKAVADTQVLIGDGTGFTAAALSGEATMSNAGAVLIADNIIDEANLKSDNSPTNDHVLTAKSSASGGLTWAATAAGAGTPYFHAKLTSNQNVTDNTSTQIAFHTATLDSASGFTTGASAKYTIPSGQGGKWFIKLGLEVDGGGAGTLNEGRSFIKIEGSVVAQTIMGLATNPGDIIQCICSCIYNVSADDDITFFGLVDNTTGSNTRFAGSSANNETSVIGFKIA